MCDVIFIGKYCGLTSSSNGRRVIMIASLLLLIFATERSDAQDQELDSLKKIYISCKRDPSKFTAAQQFEVCMGIVRIYFYDHMSDESLNWIDSALTIQGLDSSRIARLLINKGRILRDFNRIGPALQVLNSAERVALRANDPSEYGRVLTAQGLCYFNLGNYQFAIPKFYEALKVMRELNQHEIYFIYGNIAVIHYKLLNHKTALRYYMIADSLAKDENFTLAVNIALAKIALGRNSEARQDLNRLLSRDDREWERHRRLSEVFIALGLVDLAEGRRESARYHFKSSAKHAAEVKEMKFIAEDYQCLAQAYLPDYPDSALWALSISEKVATENDFDFEMLRVFQTGAEIHKMLARRKDEVYYRAKVIDKRNEVHPIQLAHLFALGISEERERLLAGSIKNQKKILFEKEKSVVAQERITLVNWLFFTTLACLSVVLYLEARQKKNIEKLLEAKLRMRCELLNFSHRSMVSSLDPIVQVLEAGNTCLIQSRRAFTATCSTQNLHNSQPST